ncbi:hypothetical protein DL93DRAFT_2035347, partial [Clavulina sp. PMI_390]
ILHIPNNIEMNGPCCYNWSWVMERNCGAIAPAIKSRYHPYTSLRLRILHLAQLNTVL